MYPGQKVRLKEVKDLPRVTRMVSDRLVEYLNIKPLLIPCPVILPLYCLAWEEVFMKVLHVKNKVIFNFWRTSYWLYKQSFLGVYLQTVRFIPSIVIDKICYIKKYKSLKTFTHCVFDYFQTVFFFPFPVMSINIDYSSSQNSSWVMGVRISF